MDLDKDLQQKEVECTTEETTRMVNSMDADEVQRLRLAEGIVRPNKQLSQPAADRSMQRTNGDQRQ